MIYSTDGLVYRTIEEWVKNSPHTCDRLQKLSAKLPNKINGKWTVAVFAEKII